MKNSKKIKNQKNLQIDGFKKEKQLVKNMIKTQEKKIL